MHRIFLVVLFLETWAHFVDILVWPWANGRLDADA